jgi:hypothetical protein
MPYPSLQNIAPHVWGPHGWKFMHAVALAYPENPSAEEKKAAFQFFTSLEYMLPCESCKQNFRKEIAAMPLIPALESKQTLNEWLTTLHNSVNKRLNKTIMSAEQVLEYVFSDANSKMVPHAEDAPSASTTSITSTDPNAANTNTNNNSNSNSNSNSNTWGITATTFAGILLIIVVVLLAVKHKQKKVLRK